MANKQQDNSDFEPVEEGFEPVESALSSAQQNSQLLENSLAFQSLATAEMQPNPALGGVQLAARQGQEEGAPLLGQVMGMPYGPVGEGVGAAAGEAYRQGVNNVLENEPIKPEEIVINGIAAAGLSKLEKTLFRKEFAAKALQELGQQLGKWKDFLRQAGDIDPTLHTPIQKILQPLRDSFSEIRNPFGEESAVLRKWLNILTNFEKKGTTALTPKTIIEMEQDMNAVAKFSKAQSSGISAPAKVKKTAANEIARDMQHLLSGETDSIAARAGLDDYASTKDKISVIKKKFPKTAEASPDTFPGAVRLLMTLTGAASAGTGATMATGNPAQGIGTGLAVLAYLDPSIRGAIFKNIVRTGISGGVRAGGQEVVRQATRE